MGMIAGITAPEIKDAVQRMFDRVAWAPGDQYRFAVGPGLARQVGFPDEILRALPAAAWESFTGLAYLHPRLALRPGEQVLDLGAGAGLDSLVAGRGVLPGGRVTGLDLSEAMVARARALAASEGASHVRFERGEAEAMPFADATFDAALVNGCFNLCPDKAAVARELLRVLRPGGRALVAEITFIGPLPPLEVRSVDDWFR
jgi:arsenite methyltransferase